MKIELKRLKIHERMSEETTAFNADLYVNGKLVGFAQNNGHGERTYWHLNNKNIKQSRSLIEQAEKYCKTLPFDKLDFEDGKTFEIPITLDYFIDKLVNETALIKAEEKQKAKLKKEMVNSLLFGNMNRKGEYTKVTFDRPIINIPTDILKQRVMKYLVQFSNKNYVLWNDIPRLNHDI